MGSSLAQSATSSSASQWAQFDKIGAEISSSDQFAAYDQVPNPIDSVMHDGPMLDAGTTATSAATPNQYAEYDLGTKDGMRKFLDDKSWQFQTGQQVSSDELATAKAIMSSYFGLEGKENLSFKAWDNRKRPLSTVLSAVAI